MLFFLKGRKVKSTKNFINGHCLNKDSHIFVKEFKICFLIMIFGTRTQNPDHVLKF